MSLFQQKQQNPGATPLEQERFRLISKIRTAQTSLWLIVIFSLVNFVTLWFNSYFLFSAQIPLFIPHVMIELKDNFAAEGVDPTVMIIVGYVLALLLLIPYIVVAFLARKHKGALIAGLVLWTLDTVFCLIMFANASDGIIDIAFHIWGIVEFIMALKSIKQLTKLPLEAPQDVSAQ